MRWDGWIDGKWPYLGLGKWEQGWWGRDTDFDVTRQMPRTGLFIYFCGKHESRVLY